MLLIEESLIFLKKMIDVLYRLKFVERYETRRRFQISLLHE